MKKKILVVDDEKNIRLLLDEELTDEGYEVIMADNGETALKMIEEEKPDIVTLDIKMPGEDGLNILRKIREIEYDLPVIICSAYSVYKSDFSAVAADHYVVKSSDFDELKNKIKEILSYEP
ncbi:sporulation initiation phosphotransferase F [bacterium BMS3Bbin05]|nr:sporulation initiation phosphotransferase F [bacterium BMS3Bbin05]